MGNHKDEATDEDVREFIKRGHFGYSGWYCELYGEYPSSNKIRNVINTAHSTWKYPMYRISRIIGKFLN
ncbi:MAG: hypothetical protein ACOCQD_00900 [archaeon]